MKIRTAHRIARLGMVTLSAAALTSLGCSLLVNFDDSLIPLPDSGGGDATTDTTTDSTTDVKNDVAADTGADTSQDVADSGSDVAAEASAETGDAIATDADAIVEETGDAIVEETSDALLDETGDAIATDTGVADTADTGVQDAADTGVADTADAAVDSVAADTASDAASDGDAAADVVSDTTPPPPVFVRVGQLVNTTVHVDVCLASNGSTPNWSTIVPLMMSTSGDAGSAGSAGIAFETLTGYFELPADTYQARVVVAGSANCGTELFTNASTFTLPAFTASTYNTIAAIGAIGGTGATALKLTSMVDDTGTVVTTVHSGRWRAFHADPTLGAIDFSIYKPSPATFYRGWTNLAYGSFVPGSFGLGGLAPKDANTYLQLPTGALAVPSPVPVAVTLTGSTTFTVLDLLTWTVGDSISFFTVATSSGSQILACDDSTPALISAGQFTSSCAEVPVFVPTAPDAGPD
ncbi:MAG: hypothetical protein ACHREM_23700, partial [Polyangiales bacterium]